LIFVFLIGFSESNHFSSHHGSGVTLSEDNTIATAVAIDHAMAYTSQPIPVGRLFQLKCLNPGIIVSELHVEKRACNYDNH
jgi:hypothetical protein